MIMRFLGTCDVCGATVPTYRALGQHLRHQKDQAHQDLKARWHQWRCDYRATLRCRKCGQLWEITDKGQRNAKRCPRCEKLRQSMTRREYEALQFDKPKDPRQPMSHLSGTKARWDGLRCRHRTWQPGDGLYVRVLAAFEGGDKVNDTRRELGISYKVYRAILAHAFGEPTVRRVMRQRKVDAAKRMVAHAQTNSGLEDGFAAQVEAVGITVESRNTWITMKVAGQRTHREVDIKIAVGDGRKVVVLCDGEAFHGPGSLYMDPEQRIADDVATAEGYYRLGYSVVRYSESEIRSGDALAHLQGVLRRLQQVQQVYRTWHPPVERVA